MEKGSGKWLREPANLIGEKHGPFVVIGLLQRLPTDKNKIWLSRCHCGNSEFKSTSQLRKNNLTGCWDCYLRSLPPRNRTHGWHKTRLYRIWVAMRFRCESPGKQNWKWYGGRGIRVCKEWAIFKNFRDWALSHGYQDHLTIERKNNDGNYEPSNCEWITRSENSRRSRLNYYARKFNQN